MSGKQTRWLIGIPAVLALGVSGAWFLPGGAGTQLEPLEVTVSGERPMELATGVNEFASLAELEQFYPAATFRLSRDIDFTRDKLVHTTWLGDGFVPPGGLGTSSVVYSQLKPRSRLAGHKVFLAVEEPRSVGRVFSQVFHEDWYTLPKSTEVNIVGPQQALLWDGAHWLCAALAVIFLLAAVTEWKWRDRKRVKSSSDAVA
jgi:hypothetical protein